MIVYLGLGVLVLVLALWLLRAFVEADPARLARGLRVFVITIGLSLAFVLLIVLVASGRLGLGLAELGGLAPLVLRGWAQWRRRRAAAAPPPGQASEVETDYLRMRLDHDSGTMSGVVRRGAFQGRRLNELGRDELDRPLARMPRRRRAGREPARSLSRPDHAGLARRRQTRRGRPRAGRAMP